MSKIFVLLTAAVVYADSPLALQVYTTLDSPQPLATVVNVSGDVSGGSGGPVWFRFRTRKADGSYTMIRDFSPIASLDWSVYDQEGVREMEVTARDNATGAAAVQSVPFEWTPISYDQSVLTQTAHPLVYLYSAPACRAGLESAVKFSGANGQLQQTPTQTCDGMHTMNFLIAGVPQDSDIKMQDNLVKGKSVVATRHHSFHSNRLAASVNLPSKWPLTNDAPDANGLVLLCALPPYPQIVTDLNGNLVWYLPTAVSFITRPSPGGHFLALFQPNGDSSQQRFIEFDLMGMIVQDTNAARVNEQLAAMGKNPITSFHHEVRLLPDGKYLVLASQEKILTGVQGNGPVDVLTDMILVLDQDLKVAWAWDAFDWLDPHRMAVLKETCANGGCPPLFLAENANDWTHGNALQLAPDGSILYSARHQDWLIKINYDGGNGDGHILWRLGKDGDFFMDSSIASPWFSHQHDAHFLTNDMTRIQLFDNGNTRWVADQTAHSRGQILQLDEDNRIASLKLNADLGTYSFALGSAQQLQNGNYYFTAGWIPDGTSRNLETDAAGKIVRTMNFTEHVYRTFRLSDIYSDSQ